MIQLYNIKRKEEGQDKKEKDDEEKKNGGMIDKNDRIIINYKAFPPLFVVRSYQY